MLKKMEIKYLAQKKSSHQCEFHFQFAGWGGLEQAAW